MTLQDLDQVNHVEVMPTIDTSPVTLDGRYLAKPSRYTDGGEITDTFGK